MDHKADHSFDESVGNSESDIPFNCRESMIRSSMKSFHTNGINNFECSSIINAVNLKGLKDNNDHDKYDSSSMAHDISSFCESQKSFVFNNKFGSINKPLNYTNTFISHNNERDSTLLEDFRAIDQR